MKGILFFIAAMLSLVGCNGESKAKQMSAISIEQPTLPDHLTVGKNLLSRDTTIQEAYPELTEEEGMELARQTGLEVPENCQLLGCREIDKRYSLAAYRIPVDIDSLRFKVYLVTRDKKGAAVDALDLHEFHTSEHQGPLRLGGNRFYTTDAELHFDGGRSVVLHRVMTLTSLYLKNHQLTELWRVEWENHYEITEEGRFRLLEQRETRRMPAELDDPVVDEYKARDVAAKR